jgi:hypothetical protein
MASTLAKGFIAHGKLDPFKTSPELVEQHKAVEKALNDEAKTNWDIPAWHKQVAADLASSLDYGFTFENLWTQYFDTQTVGEFDRVSIRERRGLKVFYTARGGWIDETQLRTELWELPRDTLGFHVSEMEDKLRAGFATTIADIVSLADARLDAEVNRRIFTTLQTAVPSGSPYYSSGTALTPTILNDLIRNVKDAIKPNGQFNVPVTIIGRAGMVDQISDFTGWLHPAQEEIRQTGFLGRYRGCNVVELNNYTDEDGLSYIPANELWVFGGTVGKFALYGPMRVKTWIEDNVGREGHRWPRPPPGAGTSLHRHGQHAVIRCDTWKGSGLRARPLRHATSRRT